MKIPLLGGVGLFVLPLMLGLAFFAASLTPSLIPRDWAFQGALGGLLTGVGYLLGRALQLLWLGLGLPPARGRAGRAGAWAATLVTLGGWLFAVGRSTAWQNSIRERLAMDPVEATQWAPMLALAAGVFALCFVLGLVALWLFTLLRARLDRVMPRRTANLLGALGAGGLLFVLTIDGLVPEAIRTLDDAYADAQFLFADAPPGPQDPNKAGGSGSLVDWRLMGQPGRNFVLDGPDAAAISALTGRPAREPIRVYVGRAQDDDPEARARLALAELERLGAFEREVLVVASPTGTGWLDPASHDPMEYLLDGDVATVAVQYSYMQSPMALIFETETGLDQADATVRTIYRYWRELPKETRPRLYIHGLSLGAWSSMHAVDLFEIFGDPIQGAFWAGPPFLSRMWRQVVARRDPASPYVSPVVADGALVRFFSQYGGLERASAPWSPIRIVYLQHASDAIVFYEPASLWRPPQWMREPPAPDVSPKMRFLPIVTQFQLALDMMLALGTPSGFGHNYAAAEYIDGWRALTAPEGWSEAQVEALKALCRGEPGEGCAN
ncbi:alpha/beta-hydrolase family protein [Albimonas sp. CAU 1670]|uniref:alpha/beta hydrolase n=1 Tax=Albimonas sp. CAU 1670 TaxID=3032599 RepID=UPI0023DC54D9|nr:alpha/beta-hydrolase family protein [Albimonas sp. CAU 1670]MDF2232382.1 alpha/beta-hydrolase family protein [Albimonas sp. CAU 1670]